MFTSLRHEFDPLDREILERAFDAALAAIGDDGVAALLHSELIEIARLKGLADPETLRDLLLARRGQTGTATDVTASRAL